MVSHRQSKLRILKVTWKPSNLFGDLVLNLNFTYVRKVQLILFLSLSIIGTAVSTSAFAQKAYRTSTGKSTINIQTHMRVGHQLRLTSNPFGCILDSLLDFSTNGKNALSRFPLVNIITMTSDSAVCRILVEATTNYELVDWNQTLSADDYSRLRIDTMNFGILHYRDNQFIILPQRPSNSDVCEKMKNRIFSISSDTAHYSVFEVANRRKGNSKLRIAPLKFSIDLEGLPDRDTLFSSEVYRQFNWNRRVRMQIPCLNN